jgi:Uncharacterized protein with a C-terminal OMP (outer membrane protein) domain
MRKLIIITFIAVLYYNSLLCGYAYATDTWTFAVAGDVRDADTTTTGVSAYLPAIATKIVSLSPQAVFVSGDLINGDELSDSPDPANPRIPYATQFENFKSALGMGSIYDAKIPIYSVRGNHENGGKTKNPTVPSLMQAYFNAMGSSVPQNGPNNGSSDNQVGYSWDLGLKNIRVVGVDDYFYYNSTPQGGSNYYKIDQAWLDKQLSKTAPKRYTFVMAHEPVYYLDAQGDFYGSTSPQGAADRQVFWDSLGTNGAKMYLCSHVHDVQVGTALDSSGNIIYQNMIGNGGAPLDPLSTQTDPALTMEYREDESYGFALFTVTDVNITISYYLYNPTSLTWSVPYTFTILANPVYSWNTGAGTFSVAGSWDPATVPGATDTAVFDRGAGTTSAVTFTADATNKRLFIANGSNTFNLTGNKYTATTTNIDGSEDSSYDPSLTISGAGSSFNTTTLTMDGTSSLTVNTGASATCGTITVEGGTARVVLNGTGNINFTTLDVGTNNLTVTGAYTQPAGSTFKLTANSSSSFGNITTDTKAIVDAGSAVNVTVGGYIPNNATLKVIDAGGLDIGSVPGTITSSNQYLTFSGAISGGNLVLTANRSGSNSFSGAGATADPNAAAVGAVLDNVTNPSADMLTVLDALGDLSPSQVASSLNSMTPTVDGAVTQSSISMLNQINGATSTHLENVRAGGGATGIATGDDYIKGVDIWAQGMGDYAHQDPRGSSNGYNATSWGVSGGADIPIYLGDSVRMGIGSGYGQTFVRSKDSSGRTNIDSIPGSIYCTYENDKYPFYLDTMFTFIYNLYKASRAVTVGTLTQRSASADYNGQQYSGYFEGGYSFFYKNLRLTPLASFNYMHLHTGSYTETGADALNLSVKAQDYDMAQTGFGVKIAYPLQQKWGTLTPDLHAKWLYDWIGDNQATTAGFAGGGTSFGTSGFRAARSAYDIGTKISLKTKYNISIDLDYDFLLKADYYEHYGSLTIKYSF